MEGIGSRANAKICLPPARAAAGQPEAVAVFFALASRRRTGSSFSSLVDYFSWLTYGDPVKQRFDAA